jgi:ABC-type sulfate transport system permease component
MDFFNIYTLVAVIVTAVIFSAVFVLRTILYIRDRKQKKAFEAAQKDEL